MTTRPSLRDYLKTILDTQTLPEGFHRDRETLQELVDARVRVRHIAAVANVSKSAVYRQMQKYDIDPPHGSGSNNSQLGKMPYLLLAHAEPNDIGGATPEGDDGWRDYYAEGEKGQ